MLKRLRFLLAGFVALGLLATLAPMVAGDNGNTIYVMRVEGPIVPVVADYLHRGLAQAQSKRAQAVIVELDTPGGLVSSAQKIIQDFLGSRIPVIVYVSPAGGWAGSAGAFITLASHVAGMSPGTFIGAAHPVTIGEPGGLPGTPSTTTSPVEEKMVNALASSIRSIAEQRRRNVDIAEDMVRKSIAKTDTEALELNLIDYRAESLTELLQKVNGKKVSLLGGAEVTLNTQGAVLKTINMSPIERILQTFSDPNIAYILLSIAMLALFVEISNPGAILPGVIGGAGLFMALYSLGTLQAQWAGILLILLAFGLFLADVFATSHGVLTAGGIASLAMGSMLLFPQSPLFQINRWLISMVSLVIAAFFVFVVTAIVRTQRQRQPTGREGMLGMVAVVKSPLKPAGTVMVHGELWQATLDEGSAEPGEEVIIRKVEGLRLRVTQKKG